MTEKVITDPNYASLCEHRCTKCGVRLAFYIKMQGRVDVAVKEAHEKGLCGVCQGFGMNEQEAHAYDRMSKVLPS